MPKHRQKWYNISINKKISEVEIDPREISTRVEIKLTLAKIENLPEKQLISLKDAAKVSGYSSDYIGQLIRAGKIPGKQVYTNISWMTTAEAVINYKNASKKQQTKPSITEKLLNTKRQLEMELGIIKLVMQNFKSTIPLLILMFVIFGAIIISIFYFSNNTYTDMTSNKQINSNIIEF